jgi:hypothetical protein
MREVTVRDTESRDKAMVLAGGVALLGSVLVPIRQNWRAKPRDGFPLSYYPMFSAKRKRHGSVVHLVGVDAEGERRVLRYSYAGTGGLNQVRRQLRRAVAAGRAQEIADNVASAVSTRPRRSDKSVVEVRVITGRYHYDDFFAGHRQPVDELVHASARVQGARP